jgi:redox-sensitive bicupin YhaK (pirin superfamily)
MLEGSVNHRDSLGNAGLIGPGDVQWMTSGRGILHEEMPRRSPDGNIYGFQLWVNLPAARKMGQPRYQEVSASMIPMVEMDGAHVRVVAGEVKGVCGPVTEIAANPIYLDVEVHPGSSFVQPIPEGHTAVAYVYEGQGEFGADTDGNGDIVEAVRMIVLSDGDHLIVRTEPGASVRFMLIAGAPFREPIVPYGPFVMNTVEEIQQTLQDLRNGTFVQS